MDFDSVYRLFASFGCQWRWQHYFSMGHIFQSICPIHLPVVSTVFDSCWAAPISLWWPPNSSFCAISNFDKLPSSKLVHCLYRPRNTFVLLDMHCIVDVHRFSIDRWFQVGHKFHRLSIVCSSSIVYRSNLSVDYNRFHLSPTMTQLDDDPNRCHSQSMPIQYTAPILLFDLLSLLMLSNLAIATIPTIFWLNKKNNNRWRKKRLAEIFDPNQNHPIVLKYSLDSFCIMNAQSLCIFFHKVTHNCNKVAAELYRSLFLFRCWSIFLPAYACFYMKCTLFTHVWQMWLAPKREHIYTHHTSSWFIIWKMYSFYHAHSKTRIIELKSSGDILMFSYALHASMANLTQLFWV